MHSPEKSFSWLQQHTPNECDAMYEGFTESLRIEIQANALTGRERAIARCLRPVHVDISTHIYPDAEVGDIYMHPIFEYEIHMRGRNWRPKGNLRLDAHEILETFQVESILSRMQNDMRIVLADMLVSMGIHDVLTSYTTKSGSKDPFEVVATGDESLPAQLYQLHTNIRAGTLSK